MATRHRVVSGRTPGAEVVDLVVTRAEGNAFYLEQLVDYLAAHPTDGPDHEDPEADDLPASLHSLVLSRIDTQPEGPRQSLKVASVLGRAFSSRLVAGTYPDLGGDDEVDGHLLAVCSTRLVDPRGPGLPHVRLRPLGHPRRGLRVDPLRGPHRAPRSRRGRHRGHSRGPDGPRPLARPAGAPLRPQRRPGAAASLLRARRGDRAQHLRPRPRRRPAATSAAARRARGPGPGPAVPGRGPGGARRLGRRRGRRRTRARGGRGRRGPRLRGTGARGAGRARPQAGTVRRRRCAVSTRRSAPSPRLDDLAGRARVLHLRGTLASQQGDPAAARAAYQESLDLRQARATPRASRPC